MPLIASDIVSLDYTLEFSKVQMYGLECVNREVLSNPSSNEKLPYPEFLGLSREQVLDKFSFYRKEVEWGAMLVLLATIEAIIRIDYKKKRRKAGRFRTLYSTHGPRTPLKDLIEAWKEERPSARMLFGNYKDALRLRNWLAHGRYFHSNVGRTHYSIDYVYELGINIQNSLY